MNIVWFCCLILLFDFARLPPAKNNIMQRSSQGPQNRTLHVIHRNKSLQINTHLHVWWITWAWYYDYSQQAMSLKPSKTYSSQLQRAIHHLLSYITIKIDDYGIKFQLSCKTRQKWFMCKHINGFEVYYCIYIWTTSRLCNPFNSLCRNVKHDLLCHTTCRRRALVVVLCISKSISFRKFPQNLCIEHKQLSTMPHGKNMGQFL